MMLRKLTSFFSLVLFINAPLSATTPAEVDTLLEKGEAAMAFAQAEAGAEAGDAELTGYLGWFYDHGHHVTRDATIAAAHYRTAAELGDAYAQWRLAVMIDEGEAAGTLDEAVRLLRRSAGQKNSDALVSLAVMHATGRGVETDYVAALRYYQTAARLGNAEGLLGMGIQHANGEGVERDMGMAVAHWIVAAAPGNGAADALLTKHINLLPDEDALRAFAQADELAQLYGVAIRFEMADNADGKGGV